MRAFRQLRLIRSKPFRVPRSPFLVPRAGHSRLTYDSTLDWCCRQSELLIQTRTMATTSSQTRSAPSLPLSNRCNESKSPYVSVTTPPRSQQLLTSSTRSDHMLPTLLPGNYGLQRLSLSPKRPIASFSSLSVTAHVIGAMSWLTSPSIILE